MGKKKQEPFNERLKKLMDSKGIKNADELALIIRYPDKTRKQVDDHEQWHRDRQSCARKIRNNLSMEDSWGIPVETMLDYAKVFECDLDYLYGLSDIPNRDKASASEELGISVEAVDTIKNLPNELKTILEKLCDGDSNKWNDENTPVQYLLEELMLYSKTKVSSITFDDGVIPKRITSYDETLKIYRQASSNELGKVLDYIREVAGDTNIQRVQRIATNTKKAIYKGVFNSK